MVQYSQGGLDAVFGALADATRRGILARLAQGEATVSELAEPYDVSLPAILKHVHVLERAGLVAGKKAGRVRRCRLRARPMREAAAWLAHYREFWEMQLDSLERYLHEQEGRTMPGHEARSRRSRKKRTRLR